MARQTFSTHGFEYTFEDNSGEIMAAFQNALERGLMAIGETAVTHAKKSLTDQKAVDTGRLRNSINYAVKDDEVYIGTPVEYAPYVEFGTGKYAEGGGGRPTPWVYQDDNGNWHWTAGNPARPFIAPAAKDHTQEYRKLLEDSLENA